MKKILMLGLLSLGLLTSCGNYSVFGDQWNFTKVHTTFDGVNYQCYKINSWNDYEGEQIGVDIDGYGYVILSSYNSFLVANKCPYCDK